MQRIKWRLAIAWIFALGLAVSCAKARDGRDGEVQPSRVAALDRTLLPLERPETLRLPLLSTEGGEPFSSDRLRGRWTLVFFGFTSCPDVCPTTLQVLSRVASESTSGVADGSTQLLFVTVDPETDTPARLKEHLAHFDGRIRGLTGNSADIMQFSDAVGAAANATASGIDHSTSLFAIDPDGRLAGVLLRPWDSARILADLDSLNVRYIPARLAAR